MLKRVTYILSLAVALVACSREDNTPTSVDFSDVITFGTVPTNTSRAATLISNSDEESFRAEPFSVYGDWLSGTGARHEVFHDVRVSYTTDPKAPTGWIYDPIQHWQQTGEYEFRAYWPASATVLGTATARTLALEYNMLIHSLHH